jgi:ferredoxin-NADP reductase
VEYTARLLMSEFETHDVKRFIVSKPEGLRFEPGQGLGLIIAGDMPRRESHPFTPTSHPDDGVLEFLIKVYPGSDNVTSRLHTLPAGEDLLVSDPFGKITYRGPGVFLAGGAGVTPFISILRDRARKGELAEQMLICSHRTPSDAICERELRHLLGPRCIMTCTRQSGPGYRVGRIDGDLLAALAVDFQRFFYVCGPTDFTKDLRGILLERGVDRQRIVM